MAPGPDWIVMWPNFTGVSGTRPFAVSCAAATPATTSSPPTPSAAPSPARNSRRPRSFAISLLHHDLDCMDAIAPRRRLHPLLRVDRAGVQLVGTGVRRVPGVRERLPLMIGATRRHTRGPPRRSGVGAHVDRGHGPVAPRPPADRPRATRNARAVGWRHDHGVDVELAHGTKLA